MGRERSGCRGQKTGACRRMARLWNVAAVLGLEAKGMDGIRDDCPEKERPRQEGEPAGAIKEGIYGAGSLAPINCF